MNTRTTMTKGMSFVRKSRMSRNRQNNVSHKRMRGSTSQMTGGVNTSMLKGPRNFKG